MITGMEVTSAEPDVPDLPLGGFMPNDAAIQIRNIDGLGPVKVDVATTGYATGRGEISSGVSTPKRNIVLTLGLNPNWIDQSVAALRQLLYHYFMPESRVHLQFDSNDLPSVYIDGIVESFEPNIFAQDPEVQISILCLRPDFIDIGTTFVTGTIVAGHPETTIDYPGTIAVGFELKVESSSALPSYTGDLTVRNTVRGLNHDLKLKNVTVDGSRYVMLNSTKTLRYVRSIPTLGDPDVFTDIYAKLDEGFEWPELLPGSNVISILTGTDGSSFTLGYIPRYGGL